MTTRKHITVETCFSCLYKFLWDHQLFPCQVFGSSYVMNIWVHQNIYILWSRLCVLLKISSFSCLKRVKTFCVTQGHKVDLQIWQKNSNGDGLLTILLQNHRQVCSFTNPRIIFKSKWVSTSKVVNHARSSWTDVSDNLEPVQILCLNRSNDLSLRFTYYKSTSCRWYTSMKVMLLGTKKSKSVVHIYFILRI